MTAELGFLYCPDCRRQSLAEIPPCPDGHGDRCPDRACVECGAALLWDVALFAARAPVDAVATLPEPATRAMNSVSPLDPVTPPDEHDAPASPNVALAGPQLFRAAVQSLTDTEVRREVRIEALRAPQKLAPYSYAVSADVLDGEGAELATGRLVLLHDPEGQEAWDGVLRLVAYASAELDEQMLVDPLLPTVGWSWLIEALDERAARYRAAGGTVTQTTSTRFGDIVGPRTSVALELRASWTADTAELGPHLRAFVDLLCAAAGLPPEGVSVLSPS